MKTQQKILLAFIAFIAGAVLIGIGSILLLSITLSLAKWELIFYIDWPIIRVLWFLGGLFGLFIFIFVRISGKK